jgi:hypothetical protein
MSADLLARIRANVEVMPNGCHEFRGNTGTKGYGLISVKSKGESVHRVVFRLCVGEIPAGMLVRHTCDNPPCCNPEHLLLGTHTDNARDRVNRGRSALGARQNGTKKLGPEKALEIRKLREAGSRVTVLAAQFGVSVSSVQDVLRRKSYAYL